MQTEICKQAGIDFPIFAFTHCRDVAAEVSKAGGLGCLGSAYMKTDEFKRDLDWLDAHVGDKPYGVDLIFMPAVRQPGAGKQLTIEEVDALVWKTIPDAHRKFVDKLLKEHNVPEWPDPNDLPSLGSVAAELAIPMAEEALKHPKCKVVVSAMDTPPAEVIEKCHKAGRLVGALTGAKKHAMRHKAAGLDFIVANGYEGGGHTGEIGSIVLWPELVDAVAPMPVLAAGGIGNGRQMLAALATGAQGVWTGSLWITVAEAQTQPKEKQRLLDATIEDTVISRSWSGKTARLLRNKWTKAWAGPESPGTLPNPAQWLLTTDARRRLERYGELGNAQDIAFSPAGQVIGQINQVETSRGVVLRLVQEYLEAFERLQGLMPNE
jgi:NAD(P)H-dependent flavin oxidoreductase YrpB (nitropropane dioxygenase family)